MNLLIEVPDPTSIQIANWLKNEGLVFARSYRNGGYPTLVTCDLYHAEDSAFKVSVPTIPAELHYDEALYFCIREITNWFNFDDEIATYEAITGHRIEVR